MDCPEKSKPVKLKLQFLQVCALPVNLFTVLKVYFTNYTDQKELQLECGPVPNVMAALPNIGSALCLMPQSLADAHY